VETPRKGKLRTGFTTGACAAAAAKAAGFGLLSGVVPQEVEIRLPIGQTARFCVHHAQTSGDGALASVIKDAGDDPDVTHGAEIVAEASWIMVPGEVRIEGGGGVGVVTKPGLELGIGEWAVNPVPRKMIRNAIHEALGGELGGKGARVVVSVPGGEELAKKPSTRGSESWEAFRSLGLRGSSSPTRRPRSRQASIKHSRSQGPLGLNGPCSRRATGRKTSPWRSFKTSPKKDSSRWAISFILPRRVP